MPTNNVSSGLSYLNICFDPDRSSCLCLKKALNAADVTVSSPSKSRPHTKSAPKCWESERNHTSEGEQEKCWCVSLVEGGWFNWSVLIWIWSWDVWGEGWIRKRWSIEETLGVRFQLYEGPLSPDSLKLLLFDWEPESERARENQGARERRRKEQFLVWSEWERGRVSSISLSLSHCLYQHHI